MTTWVGNVEHVPQLKAKSSSIHRYCTKWLLSSSHKRSLSLPSPFPLLAQMMHLKLQFENNVCMMDFCDVQYTKLMFLFTNFTCKYCFQCAICVLYIPNRLYLLISCHLMLFAYGFHKITGTTISLLLCLVLFHFGHFFFCPRVRHIPPALVLHKWAPRKAFFCSNKFRVDKRFFSLLKICLSIIFFFFCNLGKNNADIF